MKKSESEFINQYVKAVNKCLQHHMKQNGISSMKARESAQVLHDKHILALGSAGAPDAEDFIFKQLLRDSRDGKIPTIAGARQDKSKVWYIDKA